MESRSNFDVVIDGQPELYSMAEAVRAWSSFAMREPHKQKGQ